MFICIASNYLNKLQEIKLGFIFRFFLCVKYTKYINVYYFSLQFFLNESLEIQFEFIFRLIKESNIIGKLQ